MDKTTKQELADINRELERLYKKYLSDKLNIIIKYKRKTTSEANDKSEQGYIDDEINKRRWEYIHNYYGKEYMVDWKNDRRSNFFDQIYYFINGIAMVRNDDKYNYINTKGELLSLLKWFTSGSNFIDNHAEVLIGKKHYRRCLLNKNGNLIYSTSPGVYFVNDEDSEVYKKYTWGGYNDKKYTYCIIAIKNIIDNYHIKKVLGHYVCINKKDKFTIRYYPIKIYNERLALCIDNEGTFIIYDRNKKSYTKIDNYTKIKYIDNMIITNNEVYLIYSNKIIDITDYYWSEIHRQLIWEQEVVLTQGMEIMEKEEFFSLNIDEAKKLVEEEYERNKKREKIIKEEQKRKEEREKLLQAQKEEKKRKEENNRQRDQALEYLTKASQTLANLEVQVDNTRVKVDNLFIHTDDHEEIYPELIPLLKYIDLSNVYFRNVKMNGIDFRGCNIRFDPQQVYNKNLQKCNFEKLYIEPVSNFSCVDIRGAKFSRDNNPFTPEYRNPSFQFAIYDDTTTYDGVPFTEIFGPCKVQPKKRIR